MKKPNYSTIIEKKEKTKKKGKDKENDNNATSQPIHIN